MIIDKNMTGFKDPKQKLNEVQVMYEPNMHQLQNDVVVSHTGTGKTTIARMKAYKHLFSKDFPNKAVVFTFPTKALVEEKKTEFQKKGDIYSEFNIVAVTSDYSGQSPGEVEKADIILMTPEAFSHRVRNYKSDKHSWIVKKIGMVCIDEFHMIDDPQRGSHIEASLMNFCRINPKAEILCLSATIPNCEELAEWVDCLNDYNTILTQSDYRATKLHKHYIPVRRQKGKTFNEVKTAKVAEIVKTMKDSQGIIGVFNRNFGYSLEKDLEERGYKAGFHNGILNKTERHQLEANFANGSVQVLVSTSTLFAGVNLPAEYVIATSEMAGGEEIKAYQLNQMAGRAGRPQYNKDGHVFFFIEDNEKFDYHQERIENGELILSQMGVPANVGLHFLGSVYTGITKTFDDFVSWYKDSLFYHQKGEGQIDVRKICAKVEEALVEKKMIKVEKNKYELTNLGMISTQMSLDPFLLADLKRNFGAYFSKEVGYSPLNIARCLGQCAKYKSYCAEDIKSKLPKSILTKVPDSYLLSVSSYYYMLTGEHAPKGLYANLYTYKNDIHRICASLSRVSSEASNWGKDAKKLFNTLPIMVKSGLEYEVAYLVSQGASPYQAKKLLRQGFRDLKEVAE